MSDQFQSPFTPAFSTPDTAGDLVSQLGGEDLGEGNQKETANSVSGLPLQPARALLGSSGSQAGEAIPPADLFQTAGSNVARK